ncbi:MAG: efflux RND transporter periplasmic adaptor subunit [Selenomonadaceae bacterium]|nr:efflux RND transporter periplasmic adaptor subunit [Selenomonadaceae bacterium]
MKRLYVVGLVLILIFSVAMISYGTWLNKKGENQIVERMENRTIPLQGAKVQVHNIKPEIVLDTINLNSDEMADTVALIDGRIENIFVRKNSGVRRGDVIVQLVNEEIPLKIQQAESSIAKAEAQLANAKNNYARYTRLMDRDATSKEKFDEAEAAYLASEAALQEALTIKKQLLTQSAKQDVIAPIDGEVLILYKTQGSYVTAGTPIALIGNFSRLIFSMPVEDKYAQRLSIGYRAELSFTSGQILRKAYDTEYAAGNKGHEQVFPIHVIEITPPLNETATLRKIVWEVDNRVGLLEQQAYSGVILKSAHNRRVLAVPLAAMTDSNRKSVFVVTADNTLELREVKTGSNDGDFIEIISGLKEGEIVVTSATEGLESGMKVTVTLTGGDANESETK